MIYLITGQHYICQVKGQQWQEADITAGEREIQNKKENIQEWKSDYKKIFPLSVFQAAAFWDNVNAMNLLLIKGFVL